MPVNIDNTSEVLQLFASHLFSYYSLEGAITQLFRFLAKYIPADRMMCAAMDRKRHQFYVLVDYTSRGDHPLPLVTHVENVLSWRYMTNRHEKEFMEVAMIEDMRHYPEVLDHFQQLGLEPRSSMTRILKEDRDQDALLSLIVLGNTPSRFTREHAQLIATLVPILGDLVTRFALSTDGPYLYLGEPKDPHQPPLDLLRRCKGLAPLMRQVEAVADTKTLVLIQGASGTGKELVADSLHALSHRRDAPLIKVNCGAIPDTLLNSELFGHEKGAFTGASMVRRGYFEQAQRGSIFLDEIGELSLMAQTHLLRVLENGTMQHLGGDREIHLDVRVIAATHRDLRRMVREGAFREDLWYRLNVYPVSVPLLDERREDIPTLVQHFYATVVSNLGAAHPPRLTVSGIAELQRRHWPGNVRQLRYVVERALIQGIAAKHSILRFDPEDALMTPPELQTPTEVFSPDDQEKVRLEDALRRCKGRIQGPRGAAALLDMNPSTMRHHMRRLGMPLPREAKRQAR